MVDPEDYDGPDARLCPACGTHFSPEADTCLAAALDRAERAEVRIRDLEADEQIYCSTFGAMMARQVMDHMAEGRGCPGDEDMDRFSEEANEVALMTLAAAERCRAGGANPGQGRGEGVMSDKECCPKCGVRRKRMERGVWIDGQFTHRTCWGDQPGYAALQARVRELEAEVERLRKDVDFADSQRWEVEKKNKKLEAEVGRLGKKPTNG